MLNIYAFLQISNNSTPTRVDVVDMPDTGNVKIIVCTYYILKSGGPDGFFAATRT